MSNKIKCSSVFMRYVRLSFYFTYECSLSISIFNWGWHFYRTTKVVECVCQFATKFHYLFLFQVLYIILKNCEMSWCWDTLPAFSAHHEEIKFIMTSDGVVKYTAWFWILYPTSVNQLCLYLFINHQKYNLYSSCIVI